MLLKCTSKFSFTFPRPALVMGILNVTPDSFFDGGKSLSREAAIARGLKLVKEGVDILDIGGESTRPGAEVVSETEELNRVIPVIEALAPQINIPISIDTRKPAVAKAALKAGASIVNDIEANRTDPEMWKVVAETGAGYVCMHMQGTPATMQIAPKYENVLAEVEDFFKERKALLNKYGVKDEQIIFDPGIGFGKTVEHNLELLRGLKTLTKNARPILLGVSRKSFMGKLLGTETEDRLPASLACAVLVVERGVQILRVHDVTETVQAIRMTEAYLAVPE